MFLLAYRLVSAGELRAHDGERMFYTRSWAAVRLLFKNHHSGEQSDLIGTQACLIFLSRGGPDPTLVRRTRYYLITDVTDVEMRKGPRGFQ